MLGPYTTEVLKNPKSLSEYTWWCVRSQLIPTLQMSLPMCESSTVIVSLCLQNLSQNQICIVRNGIHLRGHDSPLEAVSNSRF